MRKETIAIRQRLTDEPSPHSVPLYMTSSYTFNEADEMRAKFAGEEEGNIYSRYSNPNVSEFIEKVVRLEGAESGWATASGMAAIFSTFGALLESGDHIVSSRSVFGSTHKLFTEIFPKWQIEHTYVDANDYEGFEQAITAQTKILYIETPSNPALAILDMEKLGKICKKHNVLFIVDNCFATPLIQQPIKFGADVVIHSATKFMDGQGRSLGGVIVGRKYIIELIGGFSRHSGPCLSPFNAWILSKSLETLDVRLERHCNQALAIASRLEELSDRVNWVKYPHLPSHPQYELAKRQMKRGGGLVSFEIKGGIAAGKAFLNRLQLFSLTANLGDTRSIATHPASTTHAKLTPEEREQVGITDGLIRLSIGLENLEDIWEDILRALSD
jgi:O-succinylhomoserine sulfhydrylase